LGDQIVVRGKATGTPAGEFFGVKPTGKSFNTMAYCRGWQPLKKRVRERLQDNRASLIKPWRLT
jgi:hypothetical protein